MANLEEWEVTLILTIDRDNTGKPENWNWNELLDLGAGQEDVYVLDTKFIKDIEEEEDNG